MHHDANLLAKNEGPIVITKHWVRALLIRMCFVKRQDNTKAKVEFEQSKAQLAYDVKAIGDIPDSLVINWDHIALNYIIQFMDYGRARWQEGGDSQHE